MRGVELILQHDCVDITPTYTSRGLCVSNIEATNVFSGSEFLYLSRKGGHFFDTAAKGLFCRIKQGTRTHQMGL